MASMNLQHHVVPVGPEVQRLLASKEVLVSEGAKQAVAAATVAASAELAAMRSTLQVLSSHLEALQANPAALATKGGLPCLSPGQQLLLSSGFPFPLGCWS